MNAAFGHRNALENSYRFLFDPSREAALGNELLDFGKGAAMVLMRMLMKRAMLMMLMGMQMFVMFVFMVIFMIMLWDMVVSMVPVCMAMSAMIVIILRHMNVELHS